MYPCVDAHMCTQIHIYMHINMELLSFKFFINMELFFKETKSSTSDSLENSRTGTDCKDDLI